MEKVTNWSELYSPTDPIWQSITWPRSPASAYSQTSGGWSIGGFVGGYSETALGDDTADLSITVVNTTTMRSMAEIVVFDPATQE